MAGTPGPGRPTVWVNFAASEDGRIAYAGGRPARLSSPEDLRRVQELRAQSDAILVGVGTVIADDPSLRVHWEMLGRPAGRSPTRIVVDSSGRTPPNARVLDGSAPTIVATAEGCERRFPPNITVIAAGTVRVDLAELFARLPALGVRRLMVEGGAEILASVLRGRLFDRLTVYHAPRIVGGRTAPPSVAGAESPDDPATIGLTLVSVDRLGEGYLATYDPR